ncbi:NYN domain-containing protein [Kocuria marina]|uniref:NYN domain-containing protein n=1 Tax=Kocuria marina TaxID=223184 RepID=UPI0021A718A7|nr:NYN domain-containing protein [Kocuria marina]MCT1615722.1 NYN domain-containing protein [Kocuria marina]
MTGKQRAGAYVDGFNLYYGSLKGHPDRKWLDIFKLCSTFLPGAELAHVVYCTARIVDRSSTGDASTRQDHYLQALKAAPGEVEIIEGQFQVKNKTMYRSSPATCGVCDPRFVEVVKTEEKGSDVNLAVRLVEDALTQRIEVALVISGDSDLQRAVDVARGAGVRVIVVDPRNRPQSALRADERRRLRGGNLLNCQLPTELQGVEGHRIARPQTWT